MNIRSPFHEGRTIEEAHCRSADEFIEILRTSCAHWSEPGQLSPWVFRGQADASWKLVPKSLRPGSWADVAMLDALIEPRLERFLNDATAVRRSDEPQRSRYREALRGSLIERSAIEEFMTLADELGYPLPTQAPFHEHSAWRTAYYGEFKSSDLADGHPPPTAFALAQHHGIPTRLLDFTRDALVAAFFAAQFAIESNAESERLAVWALRPHPSMLTRHGSIRVLQVPRHQMSFLHAQHGVFVYDTESVNLFLAFGEWPDLEARVDHIYGKETHSMVRKVTLPVAEAEPLIRILWTERVSRAHLMPTLDSIAASLQSRWSWAADSD